MKKFLLSVLIIMVISIAACKTAVEEKPKVQAPQQPAASGSDAAVDAVGNDLNDVNDVEEELSTDDLNDVDSGLSDVENI